MIDAFDNELVEMARKNPKVFVIGADDGRFRQRVPDNIRKQYVNVGISECNAIGMAAGLASSGKKPYVTAGGTFLVHRANEFIRNDVCMQRRNVKIVAIGAGLAMNALGNSQHMTEDIATLRAFPNLTIVTAASPIEARLIARESLKYEDPMLIRLGRYEGQDIYENYELDFQIGKGQVVLDGTDLTIMSMGTILCDVLEAAMQLKALGVSAQVINMHTIKPLDIDMLAYVEKTTGKMLVVEEHSVIGGLRSAVSEVVTECDMNIRLRGMGLKDCFARGYGSYKDIKETNGLAVVDIVKKAKTLL